MTVEGDGGGEGGVKEWGGECEDGVEMCVHISNYR